MNKAASPAPALTRGLQLMEQLAVEGQSSLEKLSALNGWPKSSVLRCLQALESRGAVRQDCESRRWLAVKRLTPMDGPTLVPMEMARKRLAPLAVMTGHCAELYRFHGDKLTLIDRAEPEIDEVMVMARIGYERSLDELDATALILYAFVPRMKRPEACWHWMTGRRKRLSAKSRDQWIARARETTCAMDADFNENGVRRFAVPVTSGESLSGVLAIAQRQTPRAAKETPFIQKTLQSKKLT